MTWREKTFAGARFWVATCGPTDCAVRARVHETPDKDYYWDVTVGLTGIVDQGRMGTLTLAKNIAAGIAGKEGRKARSKRVA